MKIIKVKHCPKKSINETFIKAIFKLKELGISLDTVEYVSIPLHMIGCISFHGIFDHSMLLRPNLEKSVFIVCMKDVSKLRPVVTAIVEIDYDLF